MERRGVVVGSLDATCSSTSSSSLTSLTASTSPTRVLSPLEAAGGGFLSHVASGLSAVAQEVQEDDLQNDLQNDPEKPQPPTPTDMLADEEEYENDFHNDLTGDETATCEEGSATVSADGCSSSSATLSSHTHTANTPTASDIREKMSFVGAENLSDVTIVAQNVSDMGSHSHLVSFTPSKESIGRCGVRVEWESLADDLLLEDWEAAAAHVEQSVVAALVREESGYYSDDFEEEGSDESLDLSP